MAIDLRATITIDLSADDFIVAADHQRKIETLMKSIMDEYASAILEIKERRPFTRRRRRPDAPLRHYTGRLSTYED